MVRANLLESCAADLLATNGGFAPSHTIWRWVVSCVHNDHCMCAA